MSQSYSSPSGRSGSGSSARGRSVQAEKPRFSDKSCPRLNVLAEQLNQANTFYNVLEKSTYTADEVAMLRADTKRGNIRPVENNEVLTNEDGSNQGRFGVTTPLDAAAGPEQSETAFSNSWIINGTGIQNMKVYAWEVSFVPNIPPQQQQLRRTALTGGRWSEYTAKCRWLRDTFGEFQFDNQMMWSESCNANLIDNQVVMEKGQFGHNPRITFTLVGQFPIEAIPVQEAERLLNVIFLRPAMLKLDFYQRDRAWFSKNPKVIKVCENRDEAALEVIIGYIVNIKMTRASTKDASTGEMKTVLRPTLKVQRKVRLEHAETVHDMLAKGKRLCESKGLDFQTQSELPGRILGRKGYITYATRQGFVIDRFNWGNNERGMISDLNKTIKQYTAEKYGIPIESIKRQFCTIQKANDEANFLPQFVKLSAQSEDAPMNYGAALLHTSGTPRVRHEQCAELVKMLEPVFAGLWRQKVNMFLEKEPVQVALHTVPNPMMHVKAKGRSDGSLTSFSPTDLPGCWGRNMGGPIEGSNLGTQRKTWAVVCQPEYKESADALCKYIMDYRGMRRLENKISEPQLRFLNLGGNIHNTEAYNTVVHPDDSMLFIIIPDGMEGSEIKAYMTKAVHYYGNHTNPPNTQFILASNANKKNPVLSAAANVLLKNDSVLYKLTTKNTAVLKNTWMIGLATSHNGASKPSVACLTLCPEPLVGTSRSWRVHATILKPRQEVMSGRNAEALLRNILMDLHERMVSKERATKVRVVDQLPQNLVIIRDGLADDQLVESMEEELLGLQSAVEKYSYYHSINWKPKMIVIVSNKKGVDDFAVCKDGRIVGKGAPRTPVVMMQRNVLSSAVADFLMITNPNNQTSKPKRLIVLRDDLELCRSKHGVVILATYLQATSWAFPFSLPFSSGNTAQSACVHIAKHYSENVSQLLTSKDEDIKWGRTNLETRPQLMCEQNPSAVGQGLE